MATDKELLEDKLDHMSRAVQQNVKIITPEDVAFGQYDGTYMLHISTNPNIRKFIPRLTLRGAPSENRDITRVYVAPTLLGCYIGYGNALHEFLMGVGENKESGHPDAPPKKVNQDFLGGFKIYAIPYEAALRPNTKLVFDQKFGDECWLVSYSPETTEFVPETAGRCFYESVVMEGRRARSPKATITMYVEVTREGGIAFSKNIFLEKGYYSIVGPEQQHVEGWKDDAAFAVTDISKSQYDKAKLGTAAMLGLKELNNVPAWTNW